MSMDKLKPCPFCGENVNFISRHGIVGWHKEDCFFQFLEDKYVDMTDEEINEGYVKAWNRRAASGWSDLISRQSLRVWIEQCEEDEFVHPGFISTKRLLAKLEKMPPAEPEYRNIQGE